MISVLDCYVYITCTLCFVSIVSHRHCRVPGSKMTGDHCSALRAFNYNFEIRYAETPKATHWMFAFRTSRKQQLLTQLLTQLPWVPLCFKEGCHQDLEAYPCTPWPQVWTTILPSTSCPSSTLAALILFIFHLFPNCLHSDLSCLHCIQHQLSQRHLEERVPETVLLQRLPSRGGIPLSLWLFHSFLLLVLDLSV